MASGIDPTDDQRKTLLFLHGMESRYGRTKPAQIEAQAKSYADKRGMKFEALSISGDNHKAQQVAAQKRINQGGVGAVLGFSAGGYTTSKLNLPKGIEKIIVGAPKAKGNQTFPGRHMDQVKGLAGPAPKQQSGPSTPTSNRSGAGGDPFSYLQQHGAHSSVVEGGKIRSGPLGGGVGFDAEFASRLAAAGQAYQERTGNAPKYGEGDRGRDVQSIYYNRYRHGGNLAALPGRSRHQSGMANDLPRSGFAKWLQQGNAKEFGLHFPMPGKDPNHIQMDPRSKLALDTGFVPGTGSTQLASAPQQQSPAAASQSRQMPTVQQVIQENINNPAFASYAGMAGMIPDQHLPVDQWAAKHGDLLKSPMVPQGMKSIFNNAMQQRPQATPAQLSAQQQGVGQQPQQSPAPQQQSVPLPQARPQGAPTGQQDRPVQRDANGQLIGGGNMLPAPPPSFSGSQQPMSQRPGTGDPYAPFASPQQTRETLQGSPYAPGQGVTPPPSMYPVPGQAPPRSGLPGGATMDGVPIPVPQQQAVNNIRPPGMGGGPMAGTGAMPQPAMQPPMAPQPPGQPVQIRPDAMQMPTQTPGQDRPVTPQPPPMPPPPMPSGNPQPGLGAGTPAFGSGSPVVGGGMNPGMIQPGLSGGSPFPFSGGGMSAGMGMGMGGGGMTGAMGGGGGGEGGGGGGGHGGKVNMQAAMAMIPKPIDISQPIHLPGADPIKPSPPMLPGGQDGGGSLSQIIMQFLQG